MRVVIQFGADASRAIHRMAAQMGRSPAEAIHDLTLAAAVLPAGSWERDEERVLKQHRPAERTAGNRVPDRDLLEWSYVNLRGMHAEGLTDREMAARFNVPNARVAAARRRLGLPANRENR